MLVKIEDWNHDGRGRGRAGRKVALVSQGHPGETVAVRVDRSTGGTVQGRVSRLDSAPVDRLPVDSVPCPHLFTCTGCPWLALPPRLEARMKHDRLQALLLNDLGLPADRLAPIATPAGPFGYRCYAKQVAFMRHGVLHLGAYVQGTHHAVDNAGCSVLQPVLRDGLVAVAEWLQREGVRAVAPQDEAMAAQQASQPVSNRAGPEDGGRLAFAVGRVSRSSGEWVFGLVLRGSGVAWDLWRRRASLLLQQVPGLVGVRLLHQDRPSNVILAAKTVAVVGRPTVRETLLGFSHDVGVGSFFQINPAAAEVLFAQAIAAALGHAEDVPSAEQQVRDDASQPASTATCLEVFAGSGALTLPLTRVFARVVAVEQDQAAVATLKQAATDHGLEEAQLAAMAANAEAVVPGLLAQEQPQVVVLDPPRKGMGEKLSEAIAKASCVQRVVLLSCEPKRLQRDLPVLSAGGFEVVRVWPVDQFPRTAHVETVTLLERKAGGAQRGDT